jgi:hypothetical protein
MNKFLIIGLSIGVLCTIAYICLSVSAKKNPDLKRAFELFIAAVGITAGVKICWYVGTGHLGDSLKKAGVPLADEDLVYFFLGGVALVWLSVDTIFDRLWAAYGVLKSSRVAAPPPPPPPPALAMGAAGNPQPPIPAK